MKCPKKIYFSRSKINNGKEKGEEKIIFQLEKNGFEILYPEELSLAEQIYYFNNAEIVSMISGSIAHNLIFSRNRNTTAIILNKTRLLNNYQFLIDNMTEANICYVDIYNQFLTVLYGEGPFLICCNKHFKKCLEDYHVRQIYIEKVKVKEFLWYMKKWRNIYKDPQKKYWLKNQKKSERKKL